MNKFILYCNIILVHAFILVGTSCSKDDNKVFDNSASKQVEFTVYSDNQHITNKAKATDSTWTKGDAIGIFMTHTKTNNISEEVINRKYTTKDGSNIFVSDPESEIYYPVDETDKVDFIAYYPYQSYINDLWMYNVDVSDQSNQASIDFLHSNNAKGKNKNSGGVNLTFSHKMSQLIIKTKAGEGLTDENLKEMKVSIKGMKTKATFNLSDSILTLDRNSVKNITPYSKILGKEYVAIIIPDTLTSGNHFEMNFKIGTDTFIWNDPNLGDVTFESGKQYIYTMTISRTEVVFTCVINPWKEYIERVGSAD